MDRERLGSWRVSAVPARVPELRRAVRAVIADRGFDDVAVGFAVTEAVTNVVRHAHSGSVGSQRLRQPRPPLALLVRCIDSEGQADRRPLTASRPFPARRVVGCRKVPGTLRSPGLQSRTFRNAPPRKTRADAPVVEHTLGHVPIAGLPNDC